MTVGGMIGRWRRRRGRNEEEIKLMHFCATNLNFFCEFTL
jgi:hypothetical protein